MKSLAIAICFLLGGSLAFAQVQQDTSSIQYEEESYESDTSSIYQEENRQEQSDLYEEEESEMEQETESEINEMEREAESEYNEMEQEAESEYNEIEQEVESEYNEAEQEVESEMDQMESEPQTQPQQASIDPSQVQVESNEKLNTDFSEYKTFGWTTQVSSEEDSGSHFMQDTELKSNLKETVKAELEGLGYTLDENNPDLLVNFKVFNEAVTLQGYSSDSYGPNYWGSSEAEQVRSIEDTTSYDVEPGTILLSMMDPEQGEIVWQGFASGLVDQSTHSFNKDNNAVAVAVELLFEEYGHRADELDSQTVK